MNEINRIPPWPSLSFMIFPPRTKSESIMHMKGRRNFISEVRPQRAPAPSVTKRPGDESLLGKGIVPQSKRQLKRISENGVRV